MKPSLSIPTIEVNQPPQSIPLGVDCDQRMIRPAWKRPKSEVDTERHQAFRDLPVREALPDAAYRLAYLTEPDAQFTRLLDHLQNMGVPMGSETWATRALSRIKHLEDIHRATMRLLREYKGPENEEVTRLRDDIGHARKMLVKAAPPMQNMCDCCGWSGARAVGNGWAACEDCLPNA